MAPKDHIASIVTLSRHRHAEIISMLQARLSLALEPDGQFQIAQPVADCSDLLNESVPAWTLVIVQYGRNDDPIVLASDLSAQDAIEAPFFDGPFVHLKLSIPEGMFLVKILNVSALSNRV
jgi:hypothetical protein